MYEWVKSNVYSLNVTLYTTNITLNSLACSYFENVRWVMIGLDTKNKKVAIKPVTKHQMDLMLVPLEHLHKISIGKGYGRISNKAIMQDISDMLGYPLNGHKFNATFNEKENLLEIDLNLPVQKGSE